MKIDIQGVARDSEESFGEKLIRYKKFLPGIICKTKPKLIVKLRVKLTVFRQGRELGFDWSLGGALSLCGY